MISQTVEYALRAIATIAQNGGAPCTAHQIAEITRVPSAYLSKLMQGLVRAGLAKSQRGLHGGFVLTKDPRELTIWDVIDAVEPIKRIQECPLGINTHGANLCLLHRRLDEALETIEAQFRRTTMAELLSHPESATPLCEEQKLLNLNATPERSGSAGRAKRDLPLSQPKKSGRPKKK